MEFSVESRESELESKDTTVVITDASVDAFITIENLSTRKFLT